MAESTRSKDDKRIAKDLNAITDISVKTLDDLGPAGLQVLMSAIELMTLQGPIGHAIMELAVIGYGHCAKRKREGLTDEQASAVGEQWAAVRKDDIYDKLARYIRDEIKANFYVVLLGLQAEDTVQVLTNLNHKGLFDVCKSTLHEIQQGHAETVVKHY